MRTLPKLLLVDDDPTVIQIMGRLLKPLASIRFASSGAEALTLAAQWVPDLVLLDAELGDMSGFDVMQTLRRDPLLKEIAIIFVTSHDEEALEVAMLQQGAADFITKPIRSAPLMARVQTQLKVRQLAHELRQMATQDGLTGVANRRAFDQAYAQAWRTSRRSRQPLALLMVDVDYFKRYNDHYGHQAGDTCLQAVAKQLQQLCERPGDMVARYGGEEFVLMLPNTGTSGAVHLAQTLLDGMAHIKLAHAASDVASYVTVSVGVATTEHPQCATPEGLLLAADKALYVAKDTGRARASLA
ncbi:MAG: hypothetical protein RLZZ591_2343 [Pseudomonadota bacterium]|jgi:diguanylate cyclase (GGDEF)-like protein